MGFLSSYFQVVDPKGRVFVPKKFLAELAPNLPRQFIATKGLDGCLAMYTSESWERATAMMRSKAEGDAGTRSHMRVFFSMAAQLAIDNAGRVSLPEGLRRQANIARDVVIVGMHDYFELWDRASWDTFNASATTVYDSTATNVRRPS